MLWTSSVLLKWVCSGTREHSCTERTVPQHHPPHQTHIHLEPVNVTLAGNSIPEDVVKLRSHGTVMCMCSVVSDSLQLHGLQPIGLLCPWDSPGVKNTGVGFHFLLQGVFPTQGLNSSVLHLLHWHLGPSPLAQPGKPTGLGWALIQWPMSLYERGRAGRHTVRRPPWKSGGRGGMLYPHPEESQGPPDPQGRTRPRDFRESRALLTAWLWTSRSVRTCISVVTRLTV